MKLFQFKSKQPVDLKTRLFRANLVFFNNAGWIQRLIAHDQIDKYLYKRWSFFSTQK